MTRGSDSLVRMATVAVAVAGSLPLLLAGCLAPLPQPLVGLNQRLEAAGPARAPSLSGDWLALIVSRDGRDRVQLVDLKRQQPVPLPGLERPDAQPLSVAVDGRGERLALVRQLEGRTELVLYRRNLMALQPVPLQPPGVPRRVSLRADGRELAVEVSRQGQWQVDLIALP
ncbi:MULTISPECIES: hypothetical protein [unclassified Cyanobium]|uniref:hypothetical protein n=1 Tax=unclassified Cyanobium TaxID=2627006 RepID=UPI0020CE0711|nr:MULTISPECIES: hypothetical protein [unclassified Cyanobium]